ncbi:VQ motif-containing protein 22 [Dendrobium catenatum]|uniref:VQ domain-containing protein n=1 Tax=Dendrobium catenatum TaxID=906689 RepID=A0A2I0WMC5_9ASPA|nr:VQ motif-containing protein 22 [Dendrobium catenatum]PKU76812.1 hypothetical protein MA16_Dca001418 [Dendrobium catenatum]
MADGSPKPACWAQLYHRTTSVAVNSDPTTDVGRSTKPPRKRSRASRRTPTTLLNTDASNFRTMVQQFTGVPSAPYIPGGPSTINLGFGFGLGLGLDNPIQQTTTAQPSFGGLHQQQYFNNFAPADQFAMNYENIDNEIFQGMNSTMRSFTG